MSTHTADLVRRWTGLQGKTAKCIRSHQELLAFLQRAENDPSTASLVGDLTVGLEDPVAFDILSRGIAALWGLTGLVLILNSPVPKGFFDGLALHSLVFLQTNVAHRDLVDFLTATPSLDTISLASCGREVHGACPLAAVDLRHVVTLEVPSTCVVGLARDGLVRLTMNGRHPSLSIPTVLRALPAPLVSLLYLTIDILPDDYNVLEEVALAAPMVESLKLVEEAGTSRRRTHDRRAWKDTSKWYRSLLLLPCLQQLALCTASSIVADPADVEAERRLLHAWVTGARPRSRQQLQPHPALSYIRIWYLRCADDNGVISHWSRDEDIWRNIVTIVGPPQDSVF